MPLDSNKSWFNSPSGQKITFVSLLIFGLFIILFGVALIKSNIKGPFATHTGWENQKQAQEQKQLIALKTNDIDHDGLVDFDEMYVYHTSPYLADTDSDGYSDKQEIDSGHDPLCSPEGNCGYLGASPAQNNSTNNSNETLENLPGQDIFQENLTQGNLTPDEIRELLKQSGFDEETLKKIDDKTLLEVYQETLKDTNNANAGSTNSANANAANDANANNANAGAANDTNNLPAEFQNMSVDEIRQLLISYGMDEKTLNSIDDETLMKIFSETVK